MLNKGREGRGRFVVLEGIDGAGKSTLSKSVLHVVRSRGYSCQIVNKHNQRVRTEGSEVLQALQRCLLSPTTAEQDVASVPKAVWLMASAAWFTVLSHQVIQPMLEQGVWVIADSWIFRRIARFSYEGRHRRGACAAML